MSYGISEKSRWRSERKMYVFIRILIFILTQKNEALRKIEHWKTKNCKMFTKGKQTCWSNLRTPQNRNRNGAGSMWLFKCDNLKREGNTRKKGKLSKAHDREILHRSFFFPFLSSTSNSRLHLNWLKTKYVFMQLTLQKNLAEIAASTESIKKNCLVFYAPFDLLGWWKSWYGETNESPFCWPKQSKYKEKNQQAPQKICLHYFPNAIESMIWCFLCK